MTWTRLRRVCSDIAGERSAAHSRRTGSLPAITTWVAARVFDAGASTRYGSTTTSASLASIGGLSTV